MSETPQDLSLAVSFPSSDQDHRIQLVDINGAIFAFVFAPLTSEGPIELNCPDWSLVLLAPIRSSKDVCVKAINIVCLSELESTEGSVEVAASNRLVQLTSKIEAPEGTSVSGKKGEHQLVGDSGSFLNLPVLFHKMITQAREGSKEEGLAAQKRIIGALCAMAEEIDKGSAKEMNMHRVLGIWQIPPNRLS